MKKIGLMLIIVLTLSAVLVCFSACNAYKDCYNETYSAHYGSLYEGDCNDPSHAHKSITVKHSVGKPYVKLNVGGTERKAKLVDDEKTTITFRGESVEVIRLQFTAKWTTIDLMGGSDKDTESVTYVYYPEGDYFIDGECILRADK